MKEPCCLPSRGSPSHRERPPCSHRGQAQRSLCGEKVKTGLLKGHDEGEKYTMTTSTYFPAWYQVAKFLPRNRPQSDSCLIQGPSPFQEVAASINWSRGRPLLRSSLLVSRWVNCEGHPSSRATEGPTKGSLSATDGSPVFPLLNPALLMPPNVFVPRATAGKVCTQISILESVSQRIQYLSQTQAIGRGFWERHLKRRSIWRRSYLPSSNQSTSYLPKMQTFSQSTLKVMRGPEESIWKIP